MSTDSGTDASKKSRDPEQESQILLQPSGSDNDNDHQMEIVDDLSSNNVPNPSVGSISNPEQQTTTTTTNIVSSTNNDNNDEKKQATPLQVVKVKVWHAVADWGFDIENDNCAICKNSIQIPCISCEAEPRENETCTPATGVCNHSYHFHCVTKWVTNHTNCPLCNMEWEFAKY